MAKRYNVSVNDALAAEIEVRAAAEFADPNDWIRRVLGDHVAGRCSNGTAASTSKVEEADAPARGRGRPKGGTIQASEWYDDVMTGTAEEARAALVAMGFIPAGPYETLEGDPENPAPPSSLMEVQAKVLVHDVIVHPEKTGELLYVQRTRTLRSKKDGDWDEASRITAPSRAELWAMAKAAMPKAA